MSWSYYIDRANYPFRREHANVEVLSRSDGWVFSPSAYARFFDPGDMRQVTEEVARHCASVAGARWPEPEGWNGSDEMILIPGRRRP